MKPRHALVPQLVAMLLATAVVSGCASWHSIGKEAPAAYVAREKPRSLRVSVAESTMVLGQPFARGDSILGTIERSGSRGEMAIPASSLRTVEGRSSSPKAARIVLGGIGLLSVGFLAALIIVHPHFSPN